MSSPSVPTYYLPPGYNFRQAFFRSFTYLKDPIKSIEESMARFCESYTAQLTPSKKIILTADPQFIEYVLKTNHRNYHKSDLTTRLGEYMGNGLLFSNGEEWLKQRRLIQPGFSRKKLQGLFSIVTEVVQESLDKFPTGGNIDVYPLCHEIAFEIVIRSLFDIHIPVEKHRDMAKNFQEMQDFLLKDMNQPFRRPFYSITGAHQKNKKKIESILDLFRAIVSQRRQSFEHYDDLLDMLLRSRYEDTGEPMEDQQLLDEILILIFAGHETTANTLAWMLHLLSTNEKITESLVEHVKSIPIEHAAMDTRLTAVIKETMRLFPAAWSTDRVALKDDEFGGFRYPKGTLVVPFFYGLHRSRKHWDTPNEFKPHRFLESDIEKSVFLPFGAGPRMCIGNHFAMAEMAIFLHQFLNRFSFSNTGYEPTLVPRITLRPDKVVLNISKK